MVWATCMHACSLQLLCKRTDLFPAFQALSCALWLATTPCEHHLPPNNPAPCTPRVPHMPCHSCTPRAWCCFGLIVMALILRDTCAITFNPKQHHHPLTPWCTPHHTVRYPSEISNLAGSCTQAAVPKLCTQPAALAVLKLCSVHTPAECASCLLQVRLQLDSCTVIRLVIVLQLSTPEVQKQYTILARSRGNQHPSHILRMCCILTAAHF